MFVQFMLHTNLKLLLSSGTLKWVKGNPEALYFDLHFFPLWFCITSLSLIFSTWSFFTKLLFFSYFDTIKALKKDFYVLPLMFFSSFNVRQCSAYSQSFYGPRLPAWYKLCIMANLFDFPFQLASAFATAEQPSIEGATSQNTNSVSTPFTLVLDSYNKAFYVAVIAYN